MGCAESKEAPPHPARGSGHHHLPRQRHPSDTTGSPSTSSFATAGAGSCLGRRGGGLGAESNFSRIDQDLSQAGLDRSQSSNNNAALFSTKKDFAQRAAAKEQNSAINGGDEELAEATSGGGSPGSGTTHTEAYQSHTDKEEMMSPGVSCPGKAQWTSGHSANDSRAPLPPPTKQQQSTSNSNSNSNHSSTSASTSASSPSRGTHPSPAGLAPKARVRWPISPPPFAQNPLRPSGAGASVGVSQAQVLPPPAVYSLLYTPTATTSSSSSAVSPGSGATGVVGSEGHRQERDGDAASNSTGEESSGTPSVWGESNTSKNAMSLSMDQLPQPSAYLRRRCDEVARARQEQQGTTATARIEQREQSTGSTGESTPPASFANTSSDSYTFSKSQGSNRHSSTSATSALMAILPTQHNHQPQQHQNLRREERVHHSNSNNGANPWPGSNHSNSANSPSSWNQLMHPGLYAGMFNEAQLSQFRSRSNSQGTSSPNTSLPRRRISQRQAHQQQHPSHLSTGNNNINTPRRSRGCGGGADMESNTGSLFSDEYPLPSAMEEADGDEEDEEDVR